jgi:predicted nucleic acid-binding protein
MREMSGIDYLIDTNILIYIIKGNPKVEYFAKSEVLAISYISEMEVLGKFQISETEKQTICDVLKHCYIFEMDAQIKQYAINIKQQIKMKLPDAIVAATAIKNNLSLVTADKDFKKVPHLDLVLIDMV